MIEAIKRGDAFAYEQAYTQYRDKVYFYFLKKTSSGDDAKDLLQITFLKLWQYRSALSSEYLLDQHLFHIARTVFIDYIRKQNTICHLQKKELEKIENAPACVYTSTEVDLETRLRTALSGMPEIRKKVFELNRLQGYSYKEIAQLLSISVKSVDNNLAKALKHLRKIFIPLIFLLIKIL
jgi:RNA polymerase sigma factor (sigma-70 family)